MEKIKVTALQRANALEALNVMWPSVPEENVIERLSNWRLNEMLVKPPTCGTIACFGGWSEWWPPFRKQLGLAPDFGDAYWGAVSGLFGPSDHPYIDSLLFARGGHVADEGFTGNDHALVTNRLKWLIANSEVVE